MCDLQIAGILAGMLKGTLKGIRQRNPSRNPSTELNTNLEDNHRSKRVIQWPPYPLSATFNGSAFKL